MERRRSPDRGGTDGQGSIRSVPSQALGGVLDVPDLLFGVFLGEAVFLFQLADELIALSVIQRDFVIGQAAPLFLELAFDLVELTAHLFLIHACLLVGFTLLLVTALLIGRLGTLLAALPVVSVGVIGVALEI